MKYMMNYEKSYIQFLDFFRYTLNPDGQSIPNIKELDWDGLYRFANEQAIAGFLFEGVKSLSEQGIKPPFELLMQWIALSEQIAGQNRLINNKCLEIVKQFKEAGFQSVVLKGQGNALMYPNPLSRCPGDIDIWVNGKIKDVISLLDSKCDLTNEVIGYHHTTFPIYNDVEVEVHWRPSWRSSPIYNIRLQHWFKEQVKYQFDNIEPESGIHVPTWDFNVVYQLQHMYRHLLEEGLGLRQVMDYYYLLFSAKDEGTCKKENVRKTLRHLGLLEFAGAMMYVLLKVFLLEDKYMIASVDEKRGWFLLNEIMQSGNFGQSDERNASLYQKKGISRSLARMMRQLRFLKDYPSEVLCAPFQVYHVIWRKLKLWRFE